MVTSNAIKKENQKKTKSNLVSKEIDITIIKKNFFDVPLSAATVIFVYLVPKALTGLSKKFFKELKPGTLLITYIYDFPKEAYKGHLKLLKRDEEKKIFVYKLLA